MTAFIQTPLRIGEMLCDECQLKLVEFDLDEYNPNEPILCNECEGAIMGINNIGVLKGDDDEPEETFTENLEELAKAQAAYPNHSPEAALANYKAGREIWDTNGDLW